MEKVVSSVCKLSHKQFRAILKKFRRKRIRQKLAKERDELEKIEQEKRENAPGYKEMQEEIRRNSELYDQFEEKERLREHKEWILREMQAQEEFKIRQRQLELEKIRKEEERKKILEEFEKQTKELEKKAEAEIAKKSLKEEALQEALANISEENKPWHNPIAPENYNVGEEKATCMFFSKTGCCRFGERCSRGHKRPDVSSTLLIKGMYSHFSIDQTGRDDYDTDIALEYEDKECYQDFKNFYNDVLPEFKKYGKVIQFKVCNNFEPHLRGNVYVQYSRDEEAIEAYKNFNGRYYAGKQITCEFTNVIRWKAAICGLHSRKLCPKGINCNFLHVFKNPHGEFWDADRDMTPRGNHRDSNSSRRMDHSYDDEASYLESKHRYGSSRHDSRYDRYDSRSDRYESRSDRYESRSDRYESRNDKYESRNDKYESRSDRYESRNNRHDSRSDRHEFRSEKYESDSSSRNDRHESKHDKYESRNDSKKNSHAASPESDSSEDYRHYSNSDRKRSRSSSSSSRTDSPDNSNKKKYRHKKKKHKNKKKKSKKHKRQEYSDNSMK